MQDIAYMSALQLAEAYRRRSLSPMEVTRALLTRIEQLDSYVNAVVHVDAEYALTMAQESEDRLARGTPLSVLDGVPVTIKDLSSVSGMPCRRGSAALDGCVPATADSPCVSRLREAGLVFLAKTATPDAGCKVVTRSSVHGVTANPYDRTRTPGGSSGGASAALAMGFGPLAVGSDGAGSIRIPASATNVFGLKPGFGRVPAFPPDIDMPLSVTGPMARQVADAAVMLDIMSRPEPRDPFAWPTPFSLPADLPSPDLRGLKIALSPRLGCRAPLADSEVDALVESAGPLLSDAGADICRADPIWPVDPFEPFQIFWETACMATVDGFSKEKQGRLDPLLRNVAECGRARTLPEYLRALKQRMDITAVSKMFFNRFDLLVGPVMPVPPYEVERDVPVGFPDEDWSWCPYTYPWNMTGQPAASVPIGFTKAGLPVGVQIIGRMNGEADILRAAAAIEQRRPLHLTYPSLG